MTQTKQEFAKLGTNTIYSLEYEAEALGSGGFGSVYRIVRINNHIHSSWALKILKETPETFQDRIERLQALVEFFEVNSLNTEGLSCVPAAILQSVGADTLAIAMRYAPGPDIDMGLPSGNPSPARRLAAAHQLARTVNRLHSNGFTLGDIAYDNIVVDPNNWALYVLDLDAAEFTHQQHYRLVGNNSGKGELCPPEYSPNSAYTQAQDLWGLAVLVHFILTDKKPMGAFGLVRTYSGTADLWPPGGHPERDNHLELLKQYGMPLVDTFIRVFGIERSSPDLRPSAGEWETLLANAQKYLYQCNCSPGNPFVVLGKNGWITVCPSCGAAIQAG